MLIYTTIENIVTMIGFRSVNHVIMTRVYSKYKIHRLLVRLTNAERTDKVIGTSDIQAGFTCNYRVYFRVSRVSLERPLSNSRLTWLRP